MERWIESVIESATKKLSSFCTVSRLRPSGLWRLPPNRDNIPGGMRSVSNDAKGNSQYSPQMMLVPMVIEQMLFLAQEDPEKDIQLYINSPGGSITAGMAIYDTMQYVKNDVVTLCVGQAASMAALLLASGEAKKRMALPNSRILIHQPSMGGLSGP